MRRYSNQPSPARCPRGINYEATWKDVPSVDGLYATHYAIFPFCFSSLSLSYLQMDDLTAVKRERSCPFHDHRREERTIVRLLNNIRIRMKGVSWKWGWDCWTAPAALVPETILKKKNQLGILSICNWIAIIFHNLTLLLIYSKIKVLVKSNQIIVVVFFVHKQYSFNSLESIHKTIFYVGNHIVTRV